ncbi:P-loop containing nucleoside triphosphate hydrolases superfamily protein [Rhynchospora pubera]|uniref:P-loop containing nucleoside triphosphate hydrolases superfamily protein n=1 Tax=Rhynchospora pubera TaxID=906938 RepID=A0AAV8ETR9_9POAL|nr:P-loop containing nucleoside triphosphate hydrolases superfamily protein [Rhynchospora pubera]
MVSKDGIAKLVLLHILAVFTVGTITATIRYHRKNKRKETKDSSPTPLLRLNSSGRVEELERFSHYVARQMGFKDASQCPQLGKLALDFLRKTDGCEEKIFAYFENEPNAAALYVKLIEELEKCVLGYFAFHWDQATFMISQALRSENEPKRKLRNMVLEATRKQRFEKVTKSLKVTRVLSTLVEEMKAIGMSPTSESHLMVPVAHCDRSPVLLLMGGGMGAGKSTVLKEIMKDAFWSEAAANAVVVEADAFKETDVIYRAISSKGHHNDMLQTAELVHQSSTDAASSLLVTALNEGRDVIMDGTLSWEPFVQQTIVMARNVHRQKYRMGVGYKVDEDGTITENYWEPVEEDGAKDQAPERKPYRIELVGVVCDAYLAVVRGIRRAVIMGRAVRVKSQLRSHKKFASAFESYCDLVDNARLFSTNSLGSAKLIGWKDGSSDLLVEPKEYDCLQKVRELNDEAASIYELYPDGATKCGSGSVWDDMVLSPSRASVHSELKAKIEAVESRAL